MYLQCKESFSSGRYFQPRGVLDAGRNAPIGCVLNGEDCKGYPFLHMVGGAGRRRKNSIWEMSIISQRASQTLLGEASCISKVQGPRERPAPCLKTGTSDFGMEQGEGRGPFGRGPY